jgi:hypothetical protein
MGATAKMVPVRDAETLDDSSIIADKACLVADSPVEDSVYANSGYTASRLQILGEQDIPHHHLTHIVQQAVVAFPTAALASAFFTASTQSWLGCLNRPYTESDPGNVATWQVGAVSNSNGMLSSQNTQTVPADGWGCERALTVRNNVAVDVDACGRPPGDSGVTIANQIAAKVGPA